MTDEVFAFSRRRCGVVMAGIWLTLFAVRFGVNILDGGVTFTRSVSGAAFVATGASLFVGFLLGLGILRYTRL